MYTREAEEQFMFGNDLLIAPPTKNYYGGYEALLPKGGWFDYWTGRRVDAKDRVHFDPKLDQLPVLVRAGAIIPRQPLVQHTDQPPQGPLELRVYPGPNCGGNLYADDGTTFGYKRGQFFRANVSCEAAGNGMRLKIAPAEGKFTPWWKSYAVVLMDAKGSPSTVTIDGQRAGNVKYDAAQKSVTVEVPFFATGAEVALQLRQSAPAQAVVSAGDGM